MLKLSREIPKHQHAEYFNWCKKDFMVMTQKFRDIRSRSRNPMDTCHWCGHHFVNGEMMALTQPKKGRNRVLCQDCATQLIDSNATPSPALSANPG